MKCPKCGQEISNDSVFCEYCGTQIKKTKTQANKKLLIIALVFFVVLSVVLGITSLVLSDEVSSWETRYIHAEEETEATLQQIYKALQRPLIITNVEMGNIYENGNIETDYGDKIYSSHTMYLKPQINYVGVSQENITLYHRLYYPDGSLSTGDSSPKGYSTSTSLNIYTGENVAYMDGWGNSTQGNWRKGKYKFEIWYKKTRIYKKEFTIY